MFITCWVVRAHGTRGVTLFKILFFNLLGVFWWLCCLGLEAQAVPPIPADYSVYPHLDRVQYLEGETFAVEGYSLWGNDFFAVANELSGVNVYQVVGDEVVAVGAGHATGSERDLAIMDWFAYVATGNQGLSRVSLAVPTAPTENNFVDLPGLATRVEASATHAFVACGTGGLAVVDLTQLGALHHVASYGTDVTAVSLDGNRLGIVNEGLFEVLDVSNPAVPVHLGTYEPASGAHNYIDAVIQGDGAYIVNHGQMERLDLSNPAAITVTDILDLNAPYYLYGCRLELEGPEVLVAGADYLGIVDFSTGTILRESKQVGEIRDAAVIAGKILTVTEQRLEIFDDGLHEHPEPAGIYSYGQEMRILDILQEDVLFGLAFSASPILVATEIGAEGGLLWSLDLELEGEAFADHSWQGSTVAVLTNSGTLRLITASRYGAVLRGSLALAEFEKPNSSDGVAFLDPQTLVVLDRGAGDLAYNLRIVDITDPDDPVQIGLYPLTLAYAHKVMVAGSVVLAARGDRVEMIDMADRTAPVFLDILFMEDFSIRIFAGESHLYSLHRGSNNTLFGSEYLSTWDISDPQNPVLTDQRGVPNSDDLVLVGNWAYQKGSGMILDLSDPAHPAPAGNFSLPNPSVSQLTEVVASREYIVTGYFGNYPGGFVHYLAAHQGTGQISGVADEIPAVGPNLALQAVPNPFNPRVELRFNLRQASFTQLKIYDLRGRLVADLGSGLREAGPHSVIWEGKNPRGENLPSGVYLARLKTTNGSDSQKILLAR